MTMNGRQSAPFDQIADDFLAGIRAFVRSIIFSRLLGVSSSAIPGDQPEGGDAARIDHPFDAGVGVRPSSGRASPHIRAVHRCRSGTQRPIIGRNMEQVSATGKGSRERRRVFERAFSDLDRKSARLPRSLLGRADATAWLPSSSARATAERQNRSLGDEAQARCEDISDHSPAAWAVVA